MQAEASAPNFKFEKTLTLIFVLVGVLALSMGSVPGLFQALEHVDPVLEGWGLDFYPLPLYGIYYQALTLHGVLNALVWTIAFICGFSMVAVVESLKRPLTHRWLSILSFVLIGIGVGFAGYAMLSGNASVLYTAYIPMMAHPLHYIGLTLVVVGTWAQSASLFLTFAAWRRETPKDVKMPIATLGIMTTWIVWDMATIGVAIEMLFIAIPWSLGLVPNANPLLARTLFWFFGHPLVYFWLLPAYTSWYAMAPKQAGGKLFSDPLARLAFMLFIILSVPVGLHHQYTDPGVGQGIKAIHGILTYGVVVPSFMTMFTLMASLEYAGKKRGGRSIPGWIMALPWGDASFTSQVLAMIVFAAGGVSGIVNASYTMNLVVHNTTWVPGHFHLTVGTAATLTFMGIFYWLMPYLTGRKLFSNVMGVAAGWLWFFGMVFFGRGMHWAGLLGVPRRVPLAQSSYFLELLAQTADRPLGGLQGASILTGIGGVLLFISGVLFVSNVVLSLFTKKLEAPVEVPLAEAYSGPEGAPAMLDNLRGWVLAAAAMVVLSYGPTFIQVLSNSGFNSPGLPFFR